MIDRNLRSVGLVATILLLLFVFMGSIPLAGQTERPAATDLQFHKFLPKVAPAQAVPKGGNQGQTINGMSVTAAQQMQALQLDKASRTPAQRKIDSNIIYTMRMLAGQPAAPGVPYLYTGVDLDENDNIVVDMAANVTEQLLQRLAAAGAQVLYTNAALRSIRAIIPPAQIEGIAASPGVIFISPKQGSMTNRVEPVLPGTSWLLWNLSPGFAHRAARVREQLAAMMFSTPGTPVTWQGSVGTEGDLTHRAWDARGTFGVNGAPLKIGVLSDGVTSLALSQATGDLPPTCGTPPCITVLPGQTGDGDEGTAILEIIHDMAPGASLFFATANNSITSFAQNIRDLRTAGCDIIVDDVFYFVETPFQDGQTAAVLSTTQAGVVTQAVNDVVADGALYFSSAGNEGNEDSNTSGTFESDFNGVASGAPLPTGNVHSFGGTPYDAITSPGLQDVGLWWADPLGGSHIDYDLYVLDATGSTILAASTNIQNGTQDPVELTGSPNLASGNRLVVLQNTGSAGVFFHLVVFRGTLAVNTAGETHGHSAASGAYTVAATPAAGAFGPGYPTGPFPNPFGPSNQVELFTSDGLRRIFFHADSTAITPGNFSSTGGTVLNKPDITAADGVSVTGVGGFGSPFYGTSAAAPSAASVAALVKSANPSLTAAQIRTALTSTAVDIMSSGFDRDAGNGIVMAWEAINSLGVTGSANPELGTITANENPGNGNGVIEAGEGASLVIQLKNTAGVKAATAVTAALTSPTPGVIVTQPGTSTYADMPAGASGGSNLAPFTFTLASNFPCGQTADFTLTVNYTGGPERVMNFTVPTGLLTLTNNLGTKPATVAGVTTATGTQVNRINRNGVVSACGTTKPFPGTITAASRTFDSYTFTACQATCLNVQLSSGNGVNLFESAYSPSFVPSNIATNYQGDAGLSGTAQAFSINTAASTPYTIVVNDVPGTSAGSSYTLQVPSCAFNCTVNQLPVAKVHDVTVEPASTGGSATASIDNGSFDPDGDAITLTQSPAGPYSLGNTSVLLSVVDTKGATAQASANVTVANPDFSIVATLPSVTVTAGQTGTEHITFTPNPGIGAPMTLTCSGLPSESNCSSTAVPAGSAQTDVVLNISTTAPSAFLTRPQAFYAAWLPFTGLGLVGMIVMAAPRKRRRAVLFLVSLLLISVLPLLVGCGGSSVTPGPPNPGTPKGTSTITVTATSGNVVHMTSFSLMVN